MYVCTEFEFHLSQSQDSNLILPQINDSDDLLTIFEDDSQLNTVANITDSNGFTGPLASSGPEIYLVFISSGDYLEGKKGFRVSLQVKIMTQNKKVTCWVQR